LLHHLDLRIISVKNMSSSVLLLGATGLVGGECLKLLAANTACQRVVVLSRKPLSAGASTHVEGYQVDFDDPESFRRYLTVDAVICALGTTMRKAGSPAAFRRVDYEYPLRFAQLALDAGARHFLLVSSAGANAKSRIFYPRVKGELEAALSRLGYPTLTIFRPSLLLGSREEFRLAERISQSIFGALGFLTPRSVRPVQAGQVAAAVISAMHSDAAGVRIVTNADMV
jgi:uncharacterized protein YbjT (DUF2867 family)